MLNNLSTIAQINRALENSFANIKKDMNEIKVSLNANSEQYSRLNKDLESTKIESVTTDKLNVLKIKIGEINETLKKVAVLERQLKSQGGSKTLQEAVAELEGKSAGLNLKLNELHKNTVSETQMKTLISQINSEINKLATSLRESETRKDEVRRRDIEEYNRYLVKRLDNANESIETLRKDLRSNITKDDLKATLDDLNKEFAGIKKEITTIYKRDNAFVRESEVKNILNDINKEFDGVSSELQLLKNGNKEFVTAKQIKGLIDDISNEFNDVRADVAKINPAKDIEDLRKQVKNQATKDDLSKEIKKIEKELDHDEIPATYGASVVLSPKTPAKKVATGPRFRKTKVFGSFLIFVSFLLLIGSIYSYYISEQLLVDNLAISAVIVFIVGMVLRAFAIIKSK